LRKLKSLIAPTHLKRLAKLITHYIVQKRIYARADEVQHSGNVRNRVVNKRYGVVRTSRLTQTVCFIETGRLIGHIKQNGVVVLRFGKTPRIRGQQSLHMEWRPTNEKCQHHSHC
jgi:hypothetical protein